MVFLLFECSWCWPVRVGRQCVCLHILQATGALRACHGQALAERYTQLRAARDAAAAAEAASAARQRARQAAAAAPAARRAQQRAERPGADEAGAGTIGYVSLLRFRHGGARHAGARRGEG